LRRLDISSLREEAIMVAGGGRAPSATALRFSVDSGWKIGYPTNANVFSFVEAEEEKEEQTVSGLPEARAIFLCIGRFESGSQFQLGKPFGELNSVQGDYLMTMPLGAAKIAVLRKKYTKGAGPNDYEMVVFDHDKGGEVVLDTGILTGFDYDPGTNRIYYAKGTVVKGYSLSAKTVFSLATLESELHEFSLNSVVYLRDTNTLLINDAYPGEGGGSLWRLQLDSRNLSRSGGRQLLRGKIGDSYALYQDYDSKRFHVYGGGLKPVAEFDLSKGDYLIGCRCLEEKKTFEIFIWRKPQQ